MFEKVKIKLFGNQPVAKISNAELELLICREFPKDTELVKQKLAEIQSDSQKGKNRIAASILKLAKADLNKIDFLINRAKADFRDIVSKAEYPRASKYGFELPNEKELKTVYLNDWNEFIEWKKCKKRTHNIGFAKVGQM